MSEPSDTTAPSETTSEAAEGSQSRGLQQALTAERKRRQDLEQRLADIEKTQREAREADAKRRGEFEQLYQTASSELEATRAQLADFQAREDGRLKKLTEANTARLAALPESFRALVPDGMTPDLVAEQLTKLESVITQNTPTGGIPPRTGAIAQDKIPTQCLKEAERYGYSDARVYFEKIWKPRMERRR